MVLTHTKTSRSRDAIRVDFNGTMTGQLMKHHSGWAHDMLFTGEGEADFNVWLNTRGMPFGSDESFSAYLPRVLAKLDLPHLSYTTLRHAAIVAAAEWASKDDMEGLARSIGTSTRKCVEVYDYCHTERAAGRFLHAWRGRADGGGMPPGEAAVNAPVVDAPRPASVLQRFMGFVGLGSSANVSYLTEDRGGPPGQDWAPEPAFKSTSIAAFRSAPLAICVPPPPTVPPPSSALAIVASGKPRVRARIDDAQNYDSFMAARKRSNVGGPGRNAAPVVRYLTRVQVEAAIASGVSAKRSAYAFAYGYETTSGNLAWLHRKLEEAMAREEE